MRRIRTHAHEDEASLLPAYSGAGIRIGVAVAIAIGPCDQASPEQLSFVRRL